MANERTIEEIKLTFLDDPTVSDKWVEAAAKLMHDFYDKLDEIDLHFYDADQLNAIYKAFTKSATNTNINMDLFFDPDINATKLEMALGAYEANIPSDVIMSVISAGIPYFKANCVFAAWGDKVDMREYINDFNAEQMLEIFSAIKSGVDYKLIADKSITPKAMRAMRVVMESGFDVSYNNGKITINEPNKE